MGYYYNISGLMVPKPAPATIEKDIDNFIDTIESDIKMLEATLAKSDLNAFKSQLEIVLQKTRAVHAKRMEADTYALMRSASGNVENCRKLLKQFITNLFSLSINMQKAQGHKTSKSASVTVEKYGTAAQNLSAVGELIDAGEHSKAQSFISDMQKMNAGSKDEMSIILDNVLSLLYSTLNDRDYTKASKIAHTKHDEYMQQVTNLGNKNKKILVVDDRPDVLNIVNSVLSPYYGVLVCTGGEDALKIMEQHSIDLFILDIEMPGMDGFQLTTKIQNNSKYSKTPIMYFTSNSSRERIKTSMELGICDFIVKPSSPETLLVQAAKYLM